MTSEMKDQNAFLLATSRSLIRIAWILEVMAASVGLTLAWAMFVEGRAAGADMTNLLITVVMAVMLAIVELAKIPLVTAAVTARWMMRLILGAALLALVAITGESFVSALERRYVVISEEVAAIQRELAAVDLQLAEIAAQPAFDEAAARTKARAEYEATLDGIAQDSQRVTQELDRQRRQRLEAANAVAASPEELARIEAALQGVAMERQAKIETQMAFYADRMAQLDSLTGTVRDEYVASSAVNVRAAPEVNAERLGILAIGQRVVSTARRDGWVRIVHGAADEAWVSGRYLDHRGTVSTAPDQAAFAELNSQHQAALDSIDAQAAAAAAPLKDQRLAILQRDAQVETGRQSAASEVEHWYSGQLAARAELDTGREAEARAAYLAAQDRIADEARAHEGRQGIADDLTDTRADLAAQLNRAVSDSQVHRFAQLIYARDTAQEVTPDMLRIVAGVWFGSLALVAAFIGPLLAFAALLVRSRTFEPEVSPTSRGPVHRLARTARRTLIGWRRFKTRTRVQTVIRKEPYKVEVPVYVDRIKEVEKPVYVDREKMVYVETQKLVPTEVPYTITEYVTEKVPELVPVPEPIIVEYPVYPTPRSAEAPSKAGPPVPSDETVHHLKGNTR